MPASDGGSPMRGGGDPFGFTISYNTASLALTLVQRLEVRLVRDVNGRDEAHLHARVVAERDVGGFENPALARVAGEAKEADVGCRGRGLRCGRVAPGGTCKREDYDQGLHYGLSFHHEPSPTIADREIRFSRQERQARQGEDE